MLLLKPYLGCNLNCKYCYQRNYHKGQYRKKWLIKNYNLDAIFEQLERFKNHEIALHGGEPLMIGHEDVKKILLKIKELTGRSSIQTNGTLIDDEYIQIFKECNTSVGISYDGPDELSEYRGKRLRVEKIIERLVKEGILVSTIIVVSKSNAGTKERLNKLKKYLLWLHGMEISGRMNPCIGSSEHELDEKTLIKTYLDLAEFCLYHNLKWSPFTDIINGLKGKERVCFLMGCDPFSTPSAIVVLKDGSLTSCMRTNFSGKIIFRHPLKYNTREEILMETPQEFGGCQGCKYWSACYGGCPSGAINNDWRNRTYICALWKTLFEYFEKILTFFGVPLNFGPPGFQPCQPYQQYLGMRHLDHLDTSHNDSHPRKLHEDSPHGDSHEDWSDHKDSC